MEIALDAALCNGLKVAVSHSRFVAAVGEELNSFENFCLETTDGGREGWDSQGANTSLMLINGKGLSS